MFDTIVIGKGLIGAAAARYLSQTSDKVAVIGPDEPQGPWHEHKGAFASHYDQGRITRALDGSPVWAQLAQRSLAEYVSIEAASGIRFYHPCGGIQIGPAPQSPDDHIAQVEQVAQTLGVEYHRYSGAEFRVICPKVKIPNEYAVLHEPTIAGYINPRQLVEAQLKIAQQQAATIINEAVTELKVLADSVELETDGGQRIEARHVLVTAGAWTQFLLGRDLGLVPTPRTIVLARLSAAEAERLKDLPTVIFYAGITNPNLTGIYMLPPIRYPDGEIYLKIGGRLAEIDIPQNTVELQEWFQSDGSRLEAESLESTLFDLVNDLRAESISVKPCVVTMTTTGEPLIEEIVPGKITVAAGGCGAAAKSSNEIGRLAAERVRRVSGQ